MKTRSIHYKVEIGKDGRVFYCDSLKKAMRWLKTMLNTEFLSINDIRLYNGCHNYDQVYISNVNMPISEFYERRRTYMNAVNKASAFMERAQRTENRKKRTERLNIFSRYYELANIVWRYHPAVWHGEI
mgnify:CR=1 FL=1